MPVSDIGDEWLALSSGLVTAEGGPDSTWWDRAFVPFASSVDGGGLLADQRRAGRGRVGEFFSEEGVSFDGWPGPVAALLQQTARSLETGRPFGGDFQPRVTPAGVLGWDVI